MQTINIETPKEICNFERVTAMPVVGITLG